MRATANPGLGSKSGARQHQDIAGLSALLARLDRDTEQCQGIDTKLLTHLLAMLCDVNQAIGSIAIAAEDPQSDERKFSVAALHFANPGKQILELAQNVCRKLAEAGGNLSQIQVGNGHWQIVPVVAAPLIALAVCSNGSDASEAAMKDRLAANIVSQKLSEISRRKTTSETASQLQLAASTLELTLKCQNQKTVLSASAQMTASLKEHLQCSKVFIGTKTSRGTCQLQACSDVARIDVNAEDSMAMKAVLDEAIIRGECGSWPPLPGNNTHQLIANKKFAGRDSVVISTPLTNQMDEFVGALAIVAGRQQIANPNLSNFVSSLSKPLGSTLATVQSHQGTRVSRLLRKAFSRSNRSKRLVVFGALVLGALMLCTPWTYSVSGDATLEPVARSYCVAPHDGMLKNTFAEPGDLVRSEQLLAEMDGREILWELAGVAADRSRASKQRDVYLAKQETSDALMAGLEVQRLENQETLLKFKESNLRMSSPIEGIILSGSLDRRENYPVTKGQLLYEIAPLDALRLEIAVPAEEVRHIQLDDEIRVFFDGFGMNAVAASVTRIHPRAEIRNDDNVFIVESLIPNQDLALRPGMAAVAKIETRRHTIGWIFFHRIAEKVRAAMPW